MKFLGNTRISKIFLRVPFHDGTNFACIFYYHLSQKHICKFVETIKIIEKSRLSETRGMEKWSKFISTPQSRFVFDQTRTPQTSKPPKTPNANVISIIMHETTCALSPSPLQRCMRSDWPEASGKKSGPLESRNPCRDGSRGRLPPENDD